MWRVVNSLSISTSSRLKFRGLVITIVNPFTDWAVWNEPPFVLTEMASINRPHAYHLPSETELAHTQVVIAHRRDRIQFIDQSIEAENLLLDTAINALEAHFAPSIANVKAEIKKLIEREEAKMALLEKKRANQEESLREATKQKIKNLEEERAELDKEIGNDKGFIAPIRRLPSELLSEVFIWSGINGKPWHITKVCRSWRSVALRTPQLWSHIALTESSGSLKSSYARGYGYTDFSRRLKTVPSEEEGEGSQKCKTVRGLEKALKLAGNTQLCIIISIGQLDHYSYILDDLATKTERINMLDVLTEHFPRIQSLIIRNLPDLKLQRDGIDIFRPSVFQGKLPVLQELEVAPAARNQFINTLMESVQSSARRLQSLTYSVPTGIWGLPDGVAGFVLTKEPLSKLTSLRLGAGSMPFDKTVWESMPNLEELEFSAHILTDWSALSLPNLKRLTITGGEGRDLGGHFPRLKYLSLDGVTLNTPAFSISAPELETLILQNDHLEVARMIDAPVLDELRIFSKFMKKTDANQLITTIWDNTAGAGVRCLNPRKFRIEVDANDGALVKALKQMDRIEDLQVGIGAKMNLRRKLLTDLALKTKKTAKGSKGGVPVVCPNLTRLEVFPGPFNFRDRPISAPGEKLQIQNLLDGITTARPTVECVLKEEPPADIPMIGGTYWDYMDYD